MTSVIEKAKRERWTEKFAREFSTFDRSIEGDRTESSGSLSNFSSLNLSNKISIRFREIFTDYNFIANAIASADVGY